MEEVLTEYPDSVKMVITTINDETMQAVIDVLRETGRFDRSRQVLVTHGCDKIGRRLIREGLVDGAVAHFPETYGEFILPAACSLLLGEPVPPYLYIQNRIVTAENIDDYYPREDR